MDKSKLKKIKRAGYRVTDVKKFLGLSDTESALVELKLFLSTHLRTLREQKSISQIELAKRIGSSQSRVAKIESNNGDISLDLIVRALLAIGENPKKLGRAIAASS